jgi:O-antigen/teichoic acid export membrane protein
LTQVVLARQLGPAAFGAFAAALGMVTLVAPLASFGVGSFWLRAFGQEGWRGVRWLRSSLQYSMLTTATVLAALYVWAGFGPHDPTTRGVLVALSAYLLGQVAVALVSAKLQLEERYFDLAMWQFLPHLLRLLAVLILAFAMMDMMTLRGVALAYAAISMGIFGLGAVLLWRMYVGKFDLKGHGTSQAQVGAKPKTASMLQVAAQSWPFGMDGLFYLIYFQSDIILLKYIKGDEAAGIYNVAFVIMAAAYMFPSVIYQKFLMPKIHRWAEHDRARFRQVYLVGNWLMFLFGLLAMLAIWSLGNFGVKVLFGEKYLEATPLLQILALVAPIRFLSTGMGSALVTKNHIRQKVLFMGITAAINIAMNIVMIPNFGKEGAAVSTLISEVFLLGLYFWGTKDIFANSSIGR